MNKFQKIGYILVFVIGFVIQGQGRSLDHFNLVPHRQEMENRRLSQIMNAAPKAVVVINENDDLSPKLAIKKDGQNKRKNVSGIKAESEPTEFDTVTINFPKIGDEWGLSIGEIFIFNVENGYSQRVWIETWGEEGIPLYPESCEVTVPRGNYDLIAPFFKYDENEFWGISHDYFYIVENINTSKDKILELKPWESTQCLKMETFNPDGEKSRFREIKYTEDSYEIVEEANIMNAYSEHYFYCEDVLVYTSSVRPLGFNAEKSEFAGRYSSDEQCNIYVNRVSDRYLFRTIKVMPSWPFENGIYITATECRGGVEGTYTNSEYVYDDRKIANSPMADKYPPLEEGGKEAQPYALSAESCTQNSISNDGVRLDSSSDEVFKVWASRPNNETSNDEHFIMYMKDLTDVIIPHEEEWGTWYMGSGTISAPTIPFGENGAMNIAEASQVFFPFCPDIEQDYYNILDRAPLFDSSVKNQAETIGDCVPLLTFYPEKYDDWETGETYNSYGRIYSGRLNENIVWANTFANMKIFNDAERIADDWEEFATWLMSNKNAKGDLIFIIDTPEFTIDNLGGISSSVIVVKDMGRNVSVPSPTMLQFRNVDGDVTRHFSDAEDGQVILSAAVMQWQGEIQLTGGTPVVETTPSYLDFVEPSNVKVYYNAYGSGKNTQHELFMVMDESIPTEFGFGTFYIGDLSQIKEPSASGWYDLTIIVEDDYGNSHEQVVSPAFRIENLTTNINDTGIAAGKIIVENGKIHTTGNENVRIYSISGMEIENNDISSGIYIVMVGTKAYKICVE